MPRPEGEIFPARRLAPNGQEPEAFIVHHTEGNPTLKSVTDYWRGGSEGRGRGLGTQYFMRPLDQELMMCKRYYELVGLTVATNGLWVNNGWYKVTKRANPTITLFSGNAQSGAVTPMGSDSLNGFVQSTNSTVASGVLWAADARL